MKKKGRGNDRALIFQLRYAICILLSCSLIKSMPNTHLLCITAFSGVLYVSVFRSVIVIDGLVETINGKRKINNNKLLACYRLFF